MYEGDETFKRKEIDFIFMDVKKNPQSEEILKNLISRVENKNLFWNTSGKIYSQIDIKNKKDVYTISEMALLLSKEGMLIKRPILFDDKKILIGYKKEFYENL